MSADKQVISLELSKSVLVPPDILQSILDLHAIISVADVSGRITYVNDKFCEISGYQQDELVGSDHRIVKSDAHSLNFFRGMWRTISQGGIWQGQVQNRRKDGSPYWVQTTIMPVVGDKGKPEQYISIRTDVTKQVQSQRALGKFKQILDQTLDSVFIFDSQTLVFNYVNLGAVEMMGFTEPELLNMTAVEIKPEFDEQQFRAMLLPLLSNETDSHTFQTVYQQKSGRYLPVEIFLQYFPEIDEGQFIAIVRDITERQRLEKQMQQAQKMEAVGQLTAGIAHDFNNILASIIGYTDLALIHSVGEGQETLRDHLGQVYKAGERARDLVQRLMDYSRRPEVVAVSVLDPLPVIKETLEILHSTLSTDIELSFEYSDYEPAMISIERIQLQQVIMNLCINARDAMRGQGKLDLHLSIMQQEQAECASCHGTIQGDYVVLSVQDDGDGMSADTLEHLFEPFFTTKEVGKGTGLGLSVIHGIMHEHKGHVHVESSLGQGTTVYLLFPIAENKLPI